jgi:hypothetical protein
VSLAVVEALGDYYAPAEENEEHPFLGAFHIWGLEKTSSPDGILTFLVLGFLYTGELDDSEE